MVKRKVIKKISRHVKRPRVTVTYSGTPRHHKIEERFFYVMIVLAAFVIAFGGATYITGYQISQCSAAPNAPSLSVSSTGNQKVVLSITPPQGQGQGPCPATSFKVFKATKSSGDCSSSIYSLALTTSSQNPTVPGLTNGATYCFKAKGVESTTGNNYESGDSNIAEGTPQATVPSAPQNLIAAAGINSLRLVWAAPSDNGGSAINGYKISRGLNSGQYSDLSSVAAGTITYNDTTALADTTYYYVVFVNNTGVVGYSSPSNEVSGTPTTPPTTSSSSTTTTTSPNATNTTDSSSTTTTLPPSTTTTSVIDTTTTTTLPTTTTTQGITEAEALSALEDANATITAYAKTKDIALASALYNQAVEAFNSQNYELTKTLSLQAKDSIKESEPASQQGPPIVLILVVVLIVIVVVVIAYFYFIKNKPATSKQPPQQEPPAAPPEEPETSTEPPYGTQ